MASKQVGFLTSDRQWDARFNTQTDGDLNRLLDAIKRDWESGRLKYVLVGGVEIGTKQFQSDYEVKHVHVAAIFHNRVSKQSILKSWDVRQGNGYYLVPRNRSYPYSGWRNHHTKTFSKVSEESLLLYEMGTLPADEKQTIRASEDEKKRKIDDILIEISDMFDAGQEDEAFKKYPRTYLQYGEKLKARKSQTKNLLPDNGDPHIWLHGYPGTGKTQVLAYIYPDYYKKNLHNKFFDLYDDKIHKHMILEDLDHEAVERLSLNFIKTLCDEAGFPVDQKYKSPQLSRTKVLITSNFTIGDIMIDGPGYEQNKRAMVRRFYQVNIYAFLTMLGLKLIPKMERDALKQSGNTDPSKLFMCWDFVRDVPTGTCLESPEYYQQRVRNSYYGKPI